MDGLLLAGIAIGEMIDVHITGAMEYDLVGELLIAETFFKHQSIDWHNAKVGSTSHRFKP